MSLTSDDNLKQEIRHLAELVCSDQADDRHLARLDDLLRGNNQHIQLFYSYLDIHATLGLMGTDMLPRSPHKFLRQGQKAANRSTMKRLLENPFILNAMILLTIAISTWGFYRIIFAPYPVATIEHKQIDSLDLDHWAYLPTLLSHQTYELESGNVTLNFARKTRVSLQGPCKFIPRGPLCLELISGEVSALIQDPQAQFRVLTNELNIVDLGTAFTVAHDKSKTEVHVSEGKVAVSPVSMDQSQTILMSADEALTFDRNTLESASTAYAPEKFATHKQQQRTILHIPGTGQNLRLGDSDPHWTVYDSHTKITSQASVIEQVPTKYRQLSTKDCRWVTFKTPPAKPAAKLTTNQNSAIQPTLEISNVYKFQTKFDLSLYDESTTEIELTFLADDYVKEIILNGHVLPVEKQTTNYDRPQKLKLTSHFVAGQNTLEIILVNRELTSSAENSKTPVQKTDIGLAVSIQATSIPRVQN